MALNTIDVRIKHKYDTFENWQQNDPVLYKGEIGIVSDGDYAGMHKIGDGTTSWKNLTFAYSKFTLTVDNTSIQNVNNQISLTDTGVTAGTYGPDADANSTNNQISFPTVTVDSKGRVTGAKVTTTTLYHQARVLDVVSSITLADTHTDTIILVNGEYTVSVPALTNGFNCIVKNISEKTVTITPINGNKIDGSDTSFTLAPYEFVTIIQHSSGCYVVNSNRANPGLVGNLCLDDDVLSSLK